MDPIYCLSSDGQIVKSDGDTVSFVPDDPGNRDYTAYEAWLVEGNTPEPWPPAE